MKSVIDNDHPRGAVTQSGMSYRATFLISIIVGLSLTTPSRGEAKQICLDQAEQTPRQTPQHINRIQINSLFQVYHTGKKSFTEKRDLICMTVAQHERAQVKFRSLSNRDKLFFKTHFKQGFLVLLALRDSDGDSILDFRIKGAGTFLANDTDADNDGISNLFDPRPQTAKPIQDKIANNDDDKDWLPNHLDWSNANRFDFVKQEKYALIDAQLIAFEKYGIVYMQGDSIFTPELADLVMDVLNIFASQYQKYNLRANAQSFTTARQYDVTVDAGVLAEVSPVNGQIIVYEEGIRNISKSTDHLIATLLTVIHEFTHVVQNAMDYPQNQKALLEQNRHLQPTVFVAYVNQLGWNMDAQNRKETLLNRGYVAHDEEVFVPVEIYKNHKLTTISRLCGTGKHPSRSKATRKTWEAFNGIHCYAFDSVREWHAEYVAVTVLSAMYSRLRQTHRRLSDKIIRRAEAKIKLDFGGQGYDYKNADKSAVNAIAEDLKISFVLLDRLNEKYLIEPFSS